MDTAIDTADTVRGKKNKKISKTKVLEEVKNFSKAFFVKEYNPVFKQKNSLVPQYVVLKNPFLTM